MKKVIIYFLILSLCIFSLTACLDMSGQDSGKTPKATATLVVTENAKEAAQAVTDTPEETATPAVTEEPDISDTPVATDVPEVTEAPEVTNGPKVTETPTPKPTATPKVTATPTPKATEAPTATPAEKTGKKYRFRNYKLLDQHYEKHGIEMGFASREDYEKAASDVINNPKALHKTESEDGDYVYYVEETNEFVVLSQDGYIRTYFLPSQGKKYYDRQ